MTNQKFVGFYVDEFTKKRWKEFAKQEKLGTLSKLIRTAVEYYIETRISHSSIENFPSISRTLKAPLTSIKGYTQLILEKEKEYLNDSTQKKIELIFNNCEVLENKINEIFNNENEEDNDFEVLIIDEDEHSRNIVSELLREEEMKVKAANSINDAILILNKTKGSIKYILIELKEPWDAIDELIKYITQKRNTISEFKPEIIFISSYSKKETEELIGKYDIEKYILKPYDFNQIRELIKSGLENE